MSQTFTSRPSVSGVRHAGGGHDGGDEVEHDGDRARRPTAADRTQRCG